MEDVESFRFIQTATPEKSKKIATTIPDTKSRVLSSFPPLPKIFSIPLSRKIKETNACDTFTVFATFMAGVLIFLMLIYTFIAVPTFTNEYKAAA